MLITLLEPINEATHLLSSSSHPTLGDLRTALLVIKGVLNNAQADDNTPQTRVAKKMNTKLNKYWRELQTTSTRQ